MSDTLLASTSAEGLQPLGSAPQRSFELVSQALRARLGEEHAALLAEPVTTEAGDRIDWYAPGGGAAVALDTLDEAAQAALRETLGRLVGDIEDEAARLDDTGTPDNQRLAEALRNAVEVPGEHMIYAQARPDGSLAPVLVHWAWIGGESRAVRGVLTAMVPRTAAAARGVRLGAAAPVPPPPGGPGPAWWWLIWLGWLVLALMLAAILWLVIAPCALAPGRLAFCPEPAARVAAAPAETRVIEDRIARLQHELALADRTCLPVPPPPPPPPPPEPAVEPAPPAAAPPPRQSSVEQRLTQRGGRRGALNFVLDWASIDDLDIHVTCPNGRTISYRNRSTCGGTLDVDANVRAARSIRDPVENVVFSNPPPGRYTIRVNLYSERTPGQKRFRVHILQRDGQNRTLTGSVGAGRNNWTTTFTVPG